MALFDIDGTLLRAGGAGRLAVELAIGELLGEGSTVSLERVEFAGRTDPWIVAEALSTHGIEPEERLVADVLERYMEHLPTQLARAHAFEVLPGVFSLLQALAGRAQLALGLGTGNTKRAAYAKLARGGLDSFFLFGGFGCDHADRSEVLRVGLERGREMIGDSDARAIVIGDTPRDVDAARSIRAECIAVTTGGYDEATLRRAGASVVVSELTAPEVFSAFD